MSSKPRRLDFDAKKQDSTSRTTNASSRASASSARDRKRSLANPYQTKKKSKQQKILLTPTNKQSRRVDDIEDADDEYVPAYIYKNIDYKRRGESTKLDDVTKKVFALVDQHYSLPTDLETNRKYGPKSGICFEEHAIRAYSLGLLEPSNPAADTVVHICTACAKEGHVRDDCSTLI